MEGIMTKQLNYGHIHDGDFAWHMKEALFWYKKPSLDLFLDRRLLLCMLNERDKAYQKPRYL